MKISRQFEECGIVAFLVATVVGLTAVTALWDTRNVLERDDGVDAHEVPPINVPVPLTSITSEAAVASVYTTCSNCGGPHPQGIAPSYEWVCCARIAPVSDPDPQQDCARCEANVRSRAVLDPADWLSPCTLRAAEAEKERGR